MRPLRFAVPIVFFALSASAQFVPPVPKTITGRGLNRTTEVPLPPPKQQWVRAMSPHFIAISAAGERRTREIVEDLETVSAALRKVDPHFAVEGDLTRVIIFARSRDSAPYFDLLVGRHTPGAFVVNSEGVAAMFIDGSHADANRTILHELVHNALAHGGTALPLWLEEGTAEFFSSATVFKDTVRFGGKLNNRAFSLRSRPLMPLDELFAVDQGSEMSGSSFFYAESWAVVDWMMRTDSAAFFRLLEDISRGMTSADALRKEFDVDPRLVDRLLESRMGRPESSISIRVQRMTGSAQTTPVSRDDAYIELATFLGGFEATRRDAERFLNAVDPKNAHGVAALAALRARDKRYDEATKLYEKALTLAPNDASIALAFAESLLGNAIGPFSGTMDVDDEAAPRFRRARKLATDVLAAGGDSARANAVIGTSYLVESDVKPGIAALRRAHELRPVRYDVSLNLYALLLRNGEIDTAQKFYDDFSSRARTPQAIFAAKSVYVREQLAIVNRFIRENKTDEALPILQNLIDATSDPAAKMDLEQHMMELREVDEANQQILTYNDAVLAANNGEVTKAIKILDQLLAKATDADVIRDANAFKKQLEKRRKGMRR